LESERARQQEDGRSAREWSRPRDDAPRRLTEDGRRAVEEDAVERRSDQRLLRRGEHSGFVLRDPTAVARGAAGRSSVVADARAALGGTQLRERAEGSPLRHLDAGRQKKRQREGKDPLGGHHRRPYLPSRTGASGAGRRWRRSPAACISGNRAPITAAARKRRRTSPCPYRGGIRHMPCSEGREEF